MACGFDNRGQYVCDAGTNISGVTDVASMNNFMANNKPSNAVTNMGSGAMMPFTPIGSGASNSGGGLFDWVSSNPGTAMMGAGSLIPNYAIEISMNHKNL